MSRAIRHLRVPALAVTATAGRVGGHGTTVTTTITTTTTTVVRRVVRE